MLYVIDTGVLLRLFDKADPDHGAIRSAFQLLKSRNDALATTSQNIREFWNVTTRPKSARGGYGLSPEQATLRIKALQRMYRLLPDQQEAFDVWKDLVSRERVFGVQVHDANIAAIGIYHEADFVLTLNPSHFQRFTPIVAVTPAEVIANG
jgi:predicted nucleic acid-binding protein